MTMLDVMPAEGISLDGTPPCDIWISVIFPLCGRPSVCRIIRICACGNRRTHFVCARCKDMMEMLGLVHLENGRACPHGTVREYI